MQRPVIRLIGRLYHVRPQMEGPLNIDRSEAPRTRGALWYLKWLFASYAAAFALFMLGVVLSLPFAGFEFAEFWFGPYGGAAQVATALVLSPFIYRRLK
jgi:hypothetical protein